MAKVPRPGSEYTRLCNVLGKIAGAPRVGASLDREDCAWLYELLEAIRSGEDVARRFTRNKKLRPMADRDFWLACDVAEHVHRRESPAYRLVAERWGMTGDAAEETVKTISKRQRTNVREAGGIGKPGTAAVIEWQRIRLLGGQKSD